MEGYLEKLEETLVNTAEELQQVTVRSAEIIQEMRSTILEQKDTIKIIKQDQEKKQNQLILTVIALFMTFIGLGVLISFYRNLRKKNIQIAHQNEEIELQNKLIEQSRDEVERQNKNVISSINYASRMQMALLPSPDTLTKVFPEGFVMLLPCKIVSGDFYWIALRDRFTFVAAVDCTGHGVPGAFMSLIGNDILNDLVYNRKLEAPDEILVHLHKEVISHLTRGNKESRDGMDLALCVIDHEKQLLHFSGAMNPLVIIKNGELQEIKGTRRTIGGQQLERRRSSVSFESHTIPLEGDEACYLFSDGYRDQFGGPENKKLMKKGFKNLLLECQQMSMQEQGAYLKKAFHEWKGGYTQLDDVLVMGFKPLAKQTIATTSKKNKVVQSSN